MSNEILAALIIAGFLGFAALVFVFALCRAAGDADRQLEHLYEAMRILNKKQERERIGERLERIKKQ